jgi:hypothetical protein
MHPQSRYALCLSGFPDPIDAGCRAVGDDDRQRKVAAVNFDETS